MVDLSKSVRDIFLGSCLTEFGVQVFRALLSFRFSLKSYVPQREND
jgi:hypothetical protein